MASAQTHIIRRQVIELDLPRQEGALDLQRTIGRLMREEVIPELEPILDSFNLGDQVIRLDRLEIDLGAFTPQQVERTFVSACVQAIKQQLIDKAVVYQLRDNLNLVDEQTNLIQVWLYYLQTGTLPWHANIHALSVLEIELEGIMTATPQTMATALQRGVQGSTYAIQRLALRFSLRWLAQLMVKIFDTPIDLLNQFLEGFGDYDKQYAGTQAHRQLYYALMVDALGDTSSPTSGTMARMEQTLALLATQTPRAIPSDNASHIIPDLIDKHVFHPSQPSLQAFVTEASRQLGTTPFAKDAGVSDNGHASAPLPDASKSTAPSPQSQAQEALRIHNAGLVICAYFLTPLFEGLGWIENGAFTSENLQHRAVYMTQFLATGQTEPEEWELPLNKIMCGMAIADPLPVDSQVSEAEQAEGRNLLEALISYWTAIGKTSIAGLRGTFLAREGHLSYESDRQEWLLQVEKKGFDILLEQLPWSMSIIKLPWMQEHIYVNWT